ncbi:MAG: hypothetical protein KBC64_01780 [Simkaniaceae bacterium]|nr:hypothetical protein [Simkaniaceae bacterium]
MSLFPPPAKAAPIVLAVTATTPLLNVIYLPYGQLLLKRWTDLVPEFTRTEGDLITLTRKEQGQFNLAHISRDEIFALQWNLSVDHLIGQGLSLPRKSEGPLDLQNRSLLDIIKYNGAFAQKARVASFIKTYHPNLVAPEPPESKILSKSLVSGRSFFWIDGTWTFLTEAVMVIHKTTEGLELVSVHLIHQDTPLIAPTLKKISTIFEKIILLNREDLPKLQEEMALFRYLFAHCCPFGRGSAAIGEWFERALYAYHGFEITHSTEKSGDLEALTAISFEQFRDGYPSTLLTLSEIESGEGGGGGGAAPPS